MRWSQGVWSEHRITEAVNDTGMYAALAYGPSGVAPSDDIREHELYFERLEDAGLGHIKRPDLLVFRAADMGTVNQAVDALGGSQELPFVSEDDARMRAIQSLALIGVECENSPWRAAQMPDYGRPLRPMRRLQGKLGLPRSAVLPTVIVKHEDRGPLRAWQEANGLPVHIWHVFYDMAFGIAFDDVERLIESGRIEPTEQTFQAPGGPTSKKVIFKIYHHHA